MKELSFEKMEEVNGGSKEGWSKACATIAVGSGVYAVGLISNWWNPIGWVSAGFIAADLVCGGMFLTD